MQGARRCAVPLVFLALLFLSGCTFKGSLRSDLNLRIDQPLPRTVQAWGYPPPTGSGGEALYYSLGVNLATARPFQFGFADGFKAGSGELVATTPNAVQT